jgi:hypothetical protein
MLLIPDAPLEQALLASDATPTEEQHELELLIREARRRQRRRRLAAGLLVLAVAAGAYVATRGNGPAFQSGPLLSRPLHLPSLQPGGHCPTTTGYSVSNSYFGGPVLGHGPVRVLLGGGLDVRTGRVEGVPFRPHSWHGLQTLWFATRYQGPFVVRAASIGARRPIAVQPNGTGLTPGSGPLVVPAGPTINTQDGYRTVPGSTWVRSPGCYGWQVDGRGFREVIVVKVVARP